ncbi:MAG TPA: FliM/FliN family flagellar motor switch protein [Deferrisomatales bacterium]|nr:FliM/FliN family flagellar motor switch protein [Deferrisomatales bacterium]
MPDAAETVAASAPGSQKDWGLLRDIPFTIRVEIGRTRMTVRDVLALEMGALVVTTKLSGEPMDISLGDDIFGRAEIIIIKDKLWARLTKITGGEM